MRYLGVDYGTKKVGLALSDEGGVLAFPHAVVPHSAALCDELYQLAVDEQVGAIVIGHSVSGRGEENAVMEGVHQCATALEARGMSVHLEPEFYTTAQARRSSADAHADAAAAALILQSFLDKLHAST